MQHKITRSSMPKNVKHKIENQYKICNWEKPSKRQRSASPEGDNDVFLLAIEDQPLKRKHRTLIGIDQRAEIKHGVAALPFAFAPFEFLCLHAIRKRLVLGRSPSRNGRTQYIYVYFEKFYTVLKETREKRTSAKKKIHVVQHAREKVSSGKP